MTTNSGDSALMLQQDACILWNREVAGGIYRMGLACHDFATTAQPGQFVMLHLKQRHPVLLRRPFSIHRLLPDSQTATPAQAPGIEIVYKVVGATTTRLAAGRPGETINLVGPLGRGFVVPDRTQAVVLAGGGMGIAPLYFLAQHLIRHFPHIRMTLFLGGRSSADLVALTEFQALGLPVHIATEDGSCGQQCLITHPLECMLAELPRPDAIYACGPVGMLACVAGLSARHNIACQVSIETMMACGMGACLGCACPSTSADRYWHACKDGPVMDAAALDFSRWPA